MAAEVRPASPEQAAFLRELFDAGLLIDTRRARDLRHGAVFEEVRAALDRRLTDEAAARGAERLRFPPLLPRRELERSGYLVSFPHLAGSIFSFQGSESDAAEQGERAGRHEDWSEFQEMTELTLMPGRVLPGLPGDRGSRTAGPAARFVDAGGAWVFRTSRPRIRPGGRSSTSTSWSGSASPRTCWPGARSGRSAGSSCSAASASTPSLDIASDPFFGRRGRMLAANQREQR